ncbi:MAG: hypothetical protein ABIL09_17475 [Gemmatimonadota bacterium]
MPDAPLLGRFTRRDLLWLQARLPPGPWRVGENYWELVDARGCVVLRLEMTASRDLAPLFCLLPDLLARALEEKQA